MYFQRITALLAVSCDPRRSFSIGYIFQGADPREQLPSESLSNCSFWGGYLNGDTAESGSKSISSFGISRYEK